MKLTVLFLVLLSPPLAIPGPVEDAGAPISVVLVLGRAGYDLDPEDTVRE